MIRLVILTLIICSNCSAGTIDPNVDDNRYLEYGSKFYYVLPLNGIKDSGSPFAGSAVALRDNIIITAAHLVNNHRSASVGETRKYPIVKVVFFKGYRQDIHPGHDIAVCKIEGALGFEWYPSLYDGGNETGAVCSLAGCGYTGNFLTGVDERRGYAKRAGSNRIDRTSDYMLYCSPSINRDSTELEYLTAAGDSGGGLFINGQLAGIHSGIAESVVNRGKAKYGAVSIHTRIKPYRQWINESADKLQASD